MDERKAEIMAKIQAVDDKLAALVKEGKLQEARDESVEESSPTAEADDDE